MRANWTLLTLQEAGVSLIDCEHRTPPSAETGYPYVMIPELRHGSLDLSKVRRITREHFLEWTRKARPRPNDVVLSRRCNPGETAVVDEGLEFALGQNLVLLRADGSRVYPAFLRWLVRGPEWWDQIRIYLNSGAVFDSLKCADVPKFQLSIPPMAVQPEVARILATLDDKIELNGRMNRTLEALARALFKSWFVDFDPVVAKAAGRKPVGMSEETARLFPDRFEDSRLGQIPKGWRVGKLREIAGINTRSIKNGYPHRIIEYIDISSVSVGRLSGTTRYELEKAPSRAQRLVSHGDTLWSCVRPNRKSYLFVQHPEPNAVASTGFAVLSSSANAPCFLHLWVTTDDFVDYLTAHAEGSAYPAVRPDSFANADVLIPAPSVLAFFEQQIGPLFERVGRNELQSRTLVPLRDMLLPKLLSGELRVRQAEKIVEIA